MIGIFDSGSGGLTFLLQLWGGAIPSGRICIMLTTSIARLRTSSEEEIQALTIAGVQKLFDAGASIVILACNTASAWTLETPKWDFSR